jgi:hypothetical protein
LLVKSSTFFVIYSSHLTSKNTNFSLTSKSTRID